MHILRAWIVMGTMALAIFFAPGANAQMTNKPYGFPGGSGISEAGEQAILNQKLFGITPRAVIRTDDGRLLTIERGPGGVPIVTTASGEVLAGVKARSFRHRMAAGQFNSFFVKTDTTSYPDYQEPNSTHVTIDSWTSGVLAGRPITYGGGSVDQWTSMVYYLN